ncbi:hypothetical protein CC1G_15466 [Coprinopsis cinerea okayama7|uniref:Uncharacterized protein n=1 Tax=Coprinopsis cinerea (strain Okayama-7 / 130 / ATCC MYA-4618 / FGSC 9003) TaxID=240176 RepID=D6RQQ8_COPC7|nr:hypothetical protein CC1G_15466 [Coprinopsis cinerea okayama7\|eukprot:XP_002910189.1 hypothetical protein CC1G_15466 [Coprinopsis cinerea okayama7\
MQLLATAVLSSIVLGRALAQDASSKEDVVTIFWPKADTTAVDWVEEASTIGAEALSTDAEGYTHYAVSRVVTQGVANGHTYLSEPTTATCTTATYTFRADASRYHADEPLNLVQPTNDAGDLGLVPVEGGRSITECVTQEDDTIVCSVRVEIPEPSARTDFLTFTGEKGPLYTIVALGAKKGGDDDGDDDSGTSALRLGGALVWLGVVAGGMAVSVY